MNESPVNYFLKEIDSHRDLIDVYLQQAATAEEWLKKLLLLNSIPNLGLRVANHLEKMESSAHHLTALDVRGAKLAKGWENTKDAVPYETSSQEAWRQDFFRLGREFMDAWQSCNQFLSESLVQQAQRPHNNTTH